MLEESPSRRERVAHGAVERIDPVKCGVRQEGQQDHGRKQVRQRLLAMAEVVFEVIPLGFERVVILVLDFPTRKVGGGKRRDILGRDGMGTCPGIAEQHLGIRGDEFAPIDHQGIVAVA